MTVTIHSPIRTIESFRLRIQVSNNGCSSIIGPLPFFNAELKKGAIFHQGLSLADIFSVCAWWCMVFVYLLYRSVISSLLCSVLPFCFRLANSCAISGWFLNVRFSRRKDYAGFPWSLFF